MTTRKDLLDREYAPRTVVTAVTVDTTELKTVDTTETTVATGRSTGAAAVDRVLEQTTDLINSEIPKGWYAQQAYRLGVDRYLGAASDARRGRSPKKLFSWLLKRA